MDTSAETAIHLYSDTYYTPIHLLVSRDSVTSSRAAQPKYILIITVLTTFRVLHTYSIPSLGYPDHEVRLFPIRLLLPCSHEDVPKVSFDLILHRTINPV